MWNNVGSLPSADEIEVSVIGPGHGESVVIHLGDGYWAIVDSCVDTSQSHRVVAPLAYLRALGVSVHDAVKFIFVSHWDDDHVQGLSDVIESCPSARVVWPGVFSEAHFISFVQALSAGSGATDGANVKNMRRTFQILAARGRTPVMAVPARELCSSPRIRTWSPSDRDTYEFLRYVAQYHPRAGKQFRRGIAPRPNLASVVVSIDWGDASVLLAADMERSNHADRGWNAVISQRKDISPLVKAEYVKVPHHGSHTGHDEGMWRHLLKEKPIAVIAPFGRGPVSTRPPKSSDVRRIARLSGRLFITAAPRDEMKGAMSAAVRRTLREQGISLTKAYASIGMVRHRRKPGGPWTWDLFGAARPAK